MRTIKFRGKDVFTDAWRYGDLVHNQKVTTTGLEPRTMVGGYEVAQRPSASSLAYTTRTARRFMRVTCCAPTNILIVI